MIKIYKFIKMFKNLFISKLSGIAKIDLITENKIDYEISERYYRLEFDEKTSKCFVTYNSGYIDSHTNTDEEMFFSREACYSLVLQIFP